MTNEEVVIELEKIKSAINEYYGLNERGKEVFRTAINAVNETSKRKNGKWIKVAYSNLAPSDSNCEHYMCSECGFYALRDNLSIKLTHYCPNCGVEMYE